MTVEGKHIFGIRCDSVGTSGSDTGKNRTPKTGSYRQSAISRQNHTNDTFSDSTPFSSAGDLPGTEAGELNGVVPAEGLIL